MKVTEGKEDDEYIVTRFDNTIPAVNVINIYGQHNMVVPTLWDGLSRPLEAGG